MRTPEFRKFVLDNGVTLVAERHEWVRAVSAGVWIKAGSCSESSSQGGISHFIEHMVFKGTEKRTPLEIATLLEVVGGDLNAFTDKEWTCYHATVLHEHLGLSLDVLSDLVINPTFPRNQIEREKKVLLQELSMVEEAPDEWVCDELLKGVWKGEPLGPPVIGTKKSIKEMTRGQLLKYYREFYRPENTVISVAGSFEFDELREHCERLFVYKGSQKTMPLKAMPSRYKPKRKHILGNTEQTHLMIAFEGVGFRDPSRLALLVLSYYLGGGMSSRLFQEVREKSGLAYTIDCDCLPFLDTGLFSVYVAVATKSLPKCLEVVGKELNRLLKSGITERELAKVQSQLRGALLLASDEMEGRQESIGRNEIVFGRYFSVAEVVDEITSVTVDQINEVARRVITPEKESIYTLGPTKPRKKKLSIFN